MLRRLVLGLLVAGVAAVLVAACRETQPNQPPEVALRSDFTARLGHLVPVVASASDADGDALDYRWELLSTPDGAAPTLDTEGGHVVVLSADTAGEYELRVVVDDGQATASDAVVITFDPNFELGPWAAMSASPYVIPEIASVYLPDPATGDPVLTEVAVLAGFVVQGGDLVLGRLEDFDGVAPSSFVRESAKFPSSEIPYEFKEDEYSEAAKAEVKSALAVLAAETGVLTFTDVTGQGFNGLRIRFIRTSVSALQGCWGEKNPVLWPGVRAVNLGDGCLNERTIKHEVLHALGFYHEHQRRDRDSYVEVTRHVEAPVGELEAQFLYVLNHFKPLDGRASTSYDWRSIMHYPLGPDGMGWWLSPKDGALPETMPEGHVGNLVPLSDEDIEAVRQLYGVPTDPDPTVRDYVVGPGRVATVTSIEGVIEDYDGGAVDATFAGIFGIGIGCPSDDPGCQPSFSPGRPWVPTSIDALGRFTVTLPASPSLDSGDGLVLCGGERMFSVSGALYVHDAPFGEPGSSPTSSFFRFRLEDPKEPIGFMVDASAIVLYAYTSTSVDLTCTETVPAEGTGSFVRDVDMRLRPGWNVMTWLQRSEGDDMVLYMRTGEPDLKVPWGVPEPLY